jgi:hypothetical protein
MINFFLRRNIGRNKFINFNRSHFNKNLNFSSKSQILIEFNAFHPFHTMGSIIANIIAKKFSSKIVAFFNYALVVSPLNETLFNNFKWILGNKLNLKTFKLYRSFGISSFVKPRTKKEYKDLVIKWLDKILIKIKNKGDITNIYINNVLVGDLLNDSYIKYFKTYTVEHEKKKFQNYLKDFLYLFFYWDDYLRKNDVKCIIGVHSTYAYGLLLRLAIYKKIRVILVNNGQIFSLDQKRPYAHQEYLDFRSKFKSLKKNYRLRALQIARESLKNRFKGKIGSKINDIVFNSSAFKRNSINKYDRVLYKSKKIKILIAAHEVWDAPNPMGKNFFSDFYKWMVFVMDVSKKTNYDWYLKNHPMQPQMKLFRGQQLTMSVTDELLKKYPHIRKIDSETSHNQIIREGIDIVLTVRGTIMLEYAYKNIPVLIATKSNFTKPYNFNLHFKSIKNYKKALLNLDKLNFRVKNKNEIEEYFFMRYIYSNPDYFFNFFSQYRKKVKTFDQYWTDDFYLFYLKKINSNLKKIIKNFEYFFETGDYIMGEQHNEQVFKKIFR